jgi:hypothetical protein
VLAGPIEFFDHYIDILLRQAVSLNKYDLGLAKSFQHEIQKFLKTGHMFTTSI